MTRFFCNYRIETWAQALKQCDYNKWAIKFCIDESFFVLFVYSWMWLGRSLLIKVFSFCFTSFSINMLLCSTALRSCVLRFPPMIGVNFLDPQFFFLLSSWVTSLKIYIKKSFNQLLNNSLLDEKKFKCLQPEKYHRKYTSVRVVMKLNQIFRALNSFYLLYLRGRMLFCFAMNFYWWKWPRC